MTQPGTPALSGFRDAPLPRDLVWGVSAPEDLHERLRDLTLTELVDVAYRFRPGDRPDEPWREVTAIRRYRAWGPHQN